MTTLRSRQSVFALLLGLLLLRVSPAHATTLVFVVDTSASMQQNDPDRLAILSLQVLADVIDPVHDDLVVLPFDDGPASPGERSTARAIARRDHPDTARFRDALLREVDQTGKRTLFSPQLRRALDVIDQRAAAGPAVVVMLTDGASNDERGDLAVLEQELLPRMRSLDLRAWFVALGPAPANQPALSRFFATHRLGGHQYAPDAAALPRVLAEALATSTGRVVEPIGTLRSGRRVPIDADGALAALDLVMVGRGPVGTSDATLATPAGSPVAPGPGDDVTGLVAAQTTHGYRRIRLLSPTPGRYTLTPRRTAEAFVVRRYAYELDLSVRGPAQVPVGRPACVEAAVLSRANAGAPPQPVTSASVLAGLAVRLEVTDPATGRARSPTILADNGQAGVDRLAGDGVFSGCIRGGPTDAGASLLGRAELSNAGQVWATSGPIGLDILPAMRLDTTPSTLSPGGGVPLSTGDRICETFRLDPPRGVLPTDPTGLDVDLQVQDASGAWVDGPHQGLAAALRVTLDGTPVPADGTATPVRWSPTAPEHEVCVQVARRDLGGPVTVRVRVRPTAAPYRAAGIDGGPVVQVTVDAPTLWERWGIVLLLTLLVAAMAAALAWLLRPIGVPPGLQLVVTPDDGDGPPMTLNARSQARDLRDLGLTVQVRKGTLTVRAESDVEQRDETGAWKPTCPETDGRVDLIAGTTYRTRGSWIRFDWGAE